MSTGATKITNLMEAIRRHLDSGRYLDTHHAWERQTKREILRPEILFVLRHGFHEKRKDYFEKIFKAWNYAIRGKTPDNKELRVIVSFDEGQMLIITAIVLNG